QVKRPFIISESTLTATSFITSSGTCLIHLVVDCEDTNQVENTIDKNHLNEDN
ncbi:4870_t:CDS:1, partial [Entrophospora sp. SA101]